MPRISNLFCAVAKQYGTLSQRGCCARQHWADLRSIQLPQRSALSLHPTASPAGAQHAVHCNGIGGAEGLTLRHQIW